MALEMGATLEDSVFRSTRIRHSPKASWTQPKPRTARPFISSIPSPRARRPFEAQPFCSTSGTGVIARSGICSGGPRSGRAKGAITRHLDRRRTFAGRHSWPPAKPGNVLLSAQALPSAASSGRGRAGRRRDLSRTGTACGVSNSQDGAVSRSSAACEIVGKGRHPCCARFGVKTERLERACRCVGGRSLHLCRRLGGEAHGFDARAGTQRFDGARLRSHHQPVWLHRSWHHLAFQWKPDVLFRSTMRSTFFFEELSKEFDVSFSLERAAVA